MAAKKLKELVEERRAPIVVHHATWSENAPHEIGPSFHAGTEKSAFDRLPEALKTAEDYEDYSPGETITASIHSYEVPRSLINPVPHKDPDFWESFNLRHSTTSRKRLNRAPEHLSTDNQKQTIKYTNRYEDKGTLSYVIPSQLVANGRIKHLGSQFAGEHRFED